jgi:hypothetical protein
MALKKIMLNLDEGLLADIEEYAGKMHLNRTAAISVLCSTALQGIKSIDTLDKLTKTLKDLQGATQDDEKCIENSK